MGQKWVKMVPGLTKNGENLNFKPTTGFAIKNCIGTHTNHSPIP